MTDDRAWLLGLMLLAFICAAQPAVAAPGSPPQLVVVSARADLVAGTLTIDGSTNIEGNPVFLNGGGQPAARGGDTVQVNTGSGVGSIVTGSTTVFIGN